MTTKLGWTLRAAIAAGIAPFLGSEPAQAQNNAFFVGGTTNVVGSALALPVDVRGEERVTEIVITNAGPAVFLHVLLIDGGNADGSDDDDDDDGGAWSGPDFSCFVTRNETTLFRFRREAGQTRLSYECSTAAPITPPAPAADFDDPVEIDTGIMFVTTEQADDFGYETVVANQLLGDATVIDFGQGVAYSFDAISFQSTTNDGNREYQFDGTEYTEFPAKLATNFIAPLPAAYWGVEALDAELILFTLDGTIGAAPTAKVGMIFYNDDEVRFSNTHTFDCFDILNLGEFDPRFLQENLGSKTGHLVLTPELVAQEDILHDNLFGDGDGIRRTPVHGWLVQSASLGQQLGDHYRYLPGDAAWGRPLGRSLTDLVPDNGDVPTLNALCAEAPCP